MTAVRLIAITLILTCAAFPQDVRVPHEMLLECTRHPSAPELVGKKISKRYDVMWCIVQNTSNQPWKLNSLMAGYALSKAGVPVVNEEFAIVDFEKSNGKFRRIFNTSIQIGTSFGGTTIGSLGPLGAVAGWFVGKGITTFTDSVTSATQNLGPQLAQVVRGMGSREVMVDPYDMAGLMVLSADQGGSYPAIVHADLTVYLDGVVISHTPPVAPVLAPVAIQKPPLIPMPVPAPIAMTVEYSPLIHPDVRVCRDLGGTPQVGFNGLLLECWAVRP